MSDETITRILHLSPKVHIYQIPPQSSTKGHTAAQWTSPPSRQIFTARLRILETSSSTTDTPLTTSLLLEDPSSGELFAEAPYTSAAVVEQALDSSRFFAVRVVGEGGMKATLGMGFEERMEAFDFGVALQEVRKVMGWEGEGGKEGGMERGKGKVGREGPGAEVKRDWSLKEGETLKVDLGGLGRRKEGGEGEREEKPPPYSGGGGFAFLPPPPGPGASKADRRRSREVPAVVPKEAEGKKLEELGFDDGEFGEFQ